MFFNYAPVPRTSERGVRPVRAADAGAVPLLPAGEAAERPPGAARHPPAHRQLQG